MAIGTCDNCERQHVPVSHFEETCCGETTQCFLCQGDRDPDPYGELDDIDERIEPCSGCGGDRGFDNETGRWQKCRDCAGTGDEVIHMLPISMHDLDLMENSDAS